MTHREQREESHTGWLEVDVQVPVDIPLVSLTLQGTGLIHHWLLGRTVGSLFARDAAGQPLDSVFRVQAQASPWSQLARVGENHRLL